MKERILLWLRNSRTAHQRLAARWLRRRGWVVFWLDEPARHCGHGTCWLDLYEQGERRQTRLTR